MYTELRLSRNLILEREGRSKEYAPVQTLEHHECPPSQSDTGYVSGREGASNGFERP